MVALLVAGSVAAMIVTQRARDEGPVAYNVALKTKPGRFRPCFRLTKDDTVDVAIVDASGRVIKMLAEGARLKGDEAAHCFDWDGRADDGQFPPAGRYRLRLTLAEADRVATSGERLRIPAGGPPS